MANLLEYQKELLRSGRPFFAYREPGASEIIILPGTGALRFGAVSVEPWSGSAVSSHIPVTDTSSEQYLAAIASLITELKGINGKLVVQRVISGSFSKFDIVEIAESFFGEPTPTLDFMLYDPTAAFWIGRSPELLLETDDGMNFTTRALAGTRASHDSGEWSEKNMREHQIVVNDITQRCQALGLNVVCESVRNFTCGAVSHILTPINLRAQDFNAGNFKRIIAELHPTPAVGAFPRTEVLPLLEKYETTPRELYGGLINIANRKAYVVLRCAHFDLKRWAIYTGSGITAESDPDDEWNETARKALPLIEFLSGF